MQLAASQMKVRISRLVADPEFYIFNYAEQNETSEFLIVNQELLEQAPFIDNRLERFARGQFTIATTQLNELVDQLPQPRPGRHFIFHHAFVCSTLLARCLAQSNAFFSLKEPHIVRRLADMQRELAVPGLIEPRNWSRLLDTHLQLLAKDYSRGDKVVIKASNLATNLVPEILQHTSRGNCLYLYSTLEQFLVSNLKKLQETQQKIPWLLQTFSQDSDFFRLHPMFSEFFRFSFLQQCALLWLLCNYNFLNSLPGNAAARVRTLDMDRLLESPQDTLARVSAFFDHRPDAEELEHMCGSIMQVHAKDPKLPYDAATRQRESERIKLRHHDDLERAEAWLAPLVGSLDIYRRLAALAV
jgi:hypothetical protein